MYIRLARIISTVFSPFLVPTYAILMALWLSILFVVPDSTKLTVAGVTFLLTAVLPMLLIVALYRVKAVNSIGLAERTERLVPYLCAVVCYSSLAVYLNSVHSPIWLTMFAVGGGLAVLVTLVINRWWKISAHAAAMGGFTAFVYLLYHSQLLIFGGMPMLYAAVIITGLVGTSRVALGLHTPMQVIAGAANGAACIILLSLFY